MDKITIHSFPRGKHHPRFGGKAMNYMVVSGPNPFGIRGGLNGAFPDEGGQERITFRTGRKFSSTEARDAAIAYATELAVAEGLEFLSRPLEKGGASTLGEAIDLAGEIADTRIRKLYETVIRPGQQRFRQELLLAYGGACAITGCRVREALEGAHIRPHLGEVTTT